MRAWFDAYLTEDFYIYIITHEYKHFSGCGTGIRSLLDCIILLNKFEKLLDWDYIRCETDKLGLTDFEETQRKLCKKLLSSFDEADFTQNETELLQYFVSSGVYGNYKIDIANICSIPFYNLSFIYLLMM